MKCVEGRYRRNNIPRNINYSVQKFASLHMINEWDHSRKLHINIYWNYSFICFLSLECLCRIVNLISNYLPYAFSSFEISLSKRGKDQSNIRTRHYFYVFLPSMMMRRQVYKERQTSVLGIISTTVYNFDRNIVLSLSLFLFVFFSISFFALLWGYSSSIQHVIYIYIYKILFLLWNISECLT